MRLLIVDDSRLDRTRIKRLINQMNADVSLAEAQDVPTALDMVAVEKFDCILLDYRLPGADGVELAAKIEESHDGDSTPMVMLTGEPTEDLAEHAIGSGLTDFLGKKNLSAEHLRQTLFNAVVKHRNETQGSLSNQVQQSPTSNKAPEIGQEDRMAIIDALDVLERAGVFDQADERGEEVFAALRRLRDSTMAILTH